MCVRVCIAHSSRAFVCECMSMCACVCARVRACVRVCVRVRARSPLKSRYGRCSPFSNNNRKFVSSRSKT